MNIPDNSIILAPASYHLALYQQILKEKNNCMNIEVITLSSFVQRYLYTPTSETLTYLYMYRERISKLSKENAFYTSKDDSMFLTACFNFIRWMKLYHVLVSDLPQSTTKENDLKEVISTCIDIQTLEDEKENILKRMPDLDSVYILNKQFDFLENDWVASLLQKGAHILQSCQQTKVQYWSCANTKKEAQCIAQTILDKNYNANDVFVATNNESEKQVLAQFFDYHQIPYTFIREISQSTIAIEWDACLNWIQKKDLDSYLNLIEILYPKDFEDIYLYLQTFPDQFNVWEKRLESIPFEKNNLMKEEDYQALQNLEKTVLNWNKEHHFIYDWSIHSFESIAKAIQEKHEIIEKEDLNIFHMVNDYYLSCKDFIQTSDDLTILIDRISNISGSSLTEIKGVLIGNRKEISGIRPITFLMGANAQNYPSLVCQDGIFNEEYISKINKLPSLQERLNLQRKQMKDSIFYNQEFYALFAQADYEGKGYEPSNELKEWLEIKEPSFQSLKENNIYEKTEFQLNPNDIQKTFFQKSSLSVSRLETFAKCPLQHYLKYGLCLKDKQEWDDIRTKGTILHSILEKTVSKYGKDYVKLSKAELKNYVRNEFEFIKKVYPNKTRWINQQIEDFTNQTTLVFKQLEFFEQNWRMHTFEQEKKFEKIFKWNDMELVFTGYVDRIDASDSSFCIFDYKSGNRQLDLEHYQTGLSLQLLTYTICYQEQTKKHPVGAFYIKLRAPFTSSTAYKLSYPSRKEGWAQENDKEDIQEFIEQKFINGWDFNGFDNYLDNNSQVSFTKKKESFEECKEQWPIIINGLLDDMNKGNIAPNHTSDACTYCSFSRICRNAREEIKRESYIEKEQ